MDETLYRRLFDAAYTGDVAALDSLMEEDLHILAKVPTGCAETPLHIACKLRHVGFARQILNLYPPFFMEFNQDGCSPLHLASANGKLEMVRLLLEFGGQNSVFDEFCMKKDKNGRTPLHCAVIRGRIDVITQLLAACLEPAMEVTVQRETFLHLAVKNNQCEAFLLLVQGPHTEALINLADNEGNTILHLATVRKQLQIIRFLERQPILDVNAVNSYGLTALDLSKDLEIRKIIRRVGGETSQNLLINTESRGKFSIFEQAINKVTNGILVMASIVAAATFQVATNPPGGVWQDGASSSNFTSDGHEPGTAILYDRDHDSYSHLLTYNTGAFIASLFLILILVYPVHPKIKIFSVNYLILYMLVSVVVVYVKAVQLTTKKHPVDARREPVFWFGLIWAILFIVVTIGQMLWGCRGN